MIDLSHKSYNSIDSYTGYFYKQKNGFTVFVNNLSDGWYTRIYNFSRLNHYAALQVKCSESCNILHYFLGNGEERTIYSIKDGERWVFYQDGPKQDFEENDKYDEIGPTRKFNFIKIKNFCNNLGINLDDPDFFKPTSTIYCEYRNDKKVKPKPICNYENAVIKLYEKIKSDANNTNVYMKETMKDNAGNEISPEIIEVQWTNLNGRRQFYLYDTDEIVLQRIKRISKISKRIGGQIGYSSGDVFKH